MDNSTKSEHVAGTDSESGGQITISDDDLLKHVLIVGGKGMGKTSALNNFVNSQISKNRPIIIFDAHRDLFEYALVALAVKDDAHTAIVDDEDPNAPELKWGPKRILQDRLNFLGSARADPRKNAARFFQAFLEKATKVETPVPQLVFIDGISKFLTLEAIRLLPALTAAGYGILAVGSYIEMGQIRSAQPELYAAIFERFASLIAFGTNDGDPEEVLADVAVRMAD